MGKVLFITYYWPPSGKASYHWPLMMVKYLPQFGWQPSVLTVKEDTFSGMDNSFFSHIDKNLKITRTESLEPFNLYRKFIGKKKGEKLIASETISTTNNSLTHKISVWIRMNLFVPDARVGWYPPAVSKMKKILESNPVDAIISVGPPHSSHLIGLTLSKKKNIPYIPVFIDPWTDIVYYKNFKRSKPTKALDNYLEKKVLKNSSAAVFVTSTMHKDYVEKYPFLKEKSHTLYWGYNEEEFNNIKFKKDTDEEVILHAGNIFDYQNPSFFWKEIKKEISSGRKLKLKFVGTVSPGIKQAISKAGLDKNTEYLGFLSYKAMLKELAEADYLLVCATEKRHVPGKLFEYLRTGKPIIAFGDDNEEVGNILKECNAGIMFSYHNSGKEFLENATKFSTNIGKVKKFDRKNIAEELANILKHV